MGKPSGDDSSNTTTSNAPKSPQIVKENEEKVVSLYPYTASQDDELSFEGNEIIKVLSKDGEWWRGQSEITNKIGLFPANYVQPYRSCKFTFLDFIFFHSFLTTVSLIFKNHFFMFFLFFFFLFNCDPISMHEILICLIKLHYKLKFIKSKYMYSF